jgi:RTA1 like protein
MTGVVNGHTSFSPYEYTPSATANISFLAIFSWGSLYLLLMARVLSIIHLFLGIKYRTWYFMTAMVLGGIGMISRRPLDEIGEIIGYIGRVGSAFDVTKDIYFIIQICCLIFAPAFYSAALYWTIGILYNFANFI